MSDPSPPLPPQSSFDPQPPPLAYAVPTTSGKPTSVVVLGIIGIVFGSIGILSTPIQLAALYFTGTMAGPTTAATTASAVGPPQPAMMTTWTIITALIGMALAIVLLIGGIGSVMLKPWARRLMLGYAYLTIVLALLMLVVNIVFLAPQMAQQFQAAGMGNVGSPVMIGLMVLGSLIGMIYPACVIIFFRRRDVVEAFESGRGLATL